jgi:heterodisulfide reductase subunit C2
MISLDAPFIDRADEPTGFNARACMNCGSCTALCPIESPVAPRLLFRYVLMGARDKVLANTTSIYACLLCGMCEANCPAGINIVENMRALRSYVNKSVHRLYRS